MFSRFQDDSQKKELKKLWQLVMNFWFYTHKTYLVLFIWLTASFSCVWSLETSLYWFVSPFHTQIPWWLDKCVLWQDLRDHLVHFMLHIRHWPFFHLASFLEKSGLMNIVFDAKGCHCCWVVFVSKTSWVEGELKFLLNIYLFSCCVVFSWVYV